MNFWSVFNTVSQRAYDSVGRKEGNKATVYFNIEALISNGTLCEQGLLSTWLLIILKNIYPGTLLVFIIPARSWTFNFSLLITMVSPGPFHPLFLQEKYHPKHLLYLFVCLPRCLSSLNTSWIPHHFVAAITNFNFFSS